MHAHTAHIEYIRCSNYRDNVHAAPHYAASTGSPHTTGIAPSGDCTVKYEDQIFFSAQNIGLSIARKRTKDTIISCIFLCVS